MSVSELTDCLKDSLENPAYVARVKAGWPVPPKSLRVVEYLGTGDLVFGGNADDRALGLDGNILPRLSSAPRAEFETIEAAHEAAKHINNRRPGSILGVSPSWRNGTTKENTCSN